MKTTHWILIAAASAVCACFVLQNNTRAASRLLPFQGRLTDTQGNLIADGPRLVQFKIYDAPVGGQAVWNGEIQKLAVNGGLVSTLLGRKANLSGVDFDRDVYLELTIDANNDGQITVADPPLLPRQSILPAVFAIEAADSRKLANHDWSALFGTNDPVNGKLNGSRIQINSISAAQIASGTITSNQIAPGGIGSLNIANGVLGAQHIANGAIGFSQIALGGIQASNLADGAITQSKLAMRVRGPNAPAGGVAISGSLQVENVRCSPGFFPDVMNMVVTLQTTGRPVFVGLVGETDGRPAAIYTTNSSIGSFTSGEFRLMEDATNVIGTSRLSIYAGGASGIASHIPPGSVHAISFPPAGLHSYKLQMRCLDGYVGVLNIRLVAFEL